MNAIFISLLMWMPFSEDLLMPEDSRIKTHYLLSVDHNQLADFAENSLTYFPSDGKFEQLFWGGLEQSITFYQTFKKSKRSLTKTFRKLKQLHKFSHKHLIRKQNPIQTTIVDAFDALKLFNGPWHGRWQQMTVHHFWLPTRSVEVALENKAMLLGFQSCFTGDGFGWNFVVEINDQIVLLGFVYHFNDRGVLSIGNPHVGLIHQDLHLTWISDNHLYDEYVCSSPDCSLGQHYVISGMRYFHDRLLSRTQSSFQAIYLSQDAELPTFQMYHRN